MKKRLFSKGLKEGFTLIELLIVITIIGILALAMAQIVPGALARARDAARKADLNTIVKVLETYNSDNGHYPLDGGCLEDVGNPQIKDFFQGHKPPKDPGGKQANLGSSSCALSYTYCPWNGAGNNYVVGTFVEVAADGNAHSSDFANDCAAPQAPVSFTKDASSDVFAISN